MSSDHAATDATVPCPACGAQNRPAARFCEQCGARMPQAAPVAPPPPVAPAAVVPPIAPVTPVAADPVAPPPVRPARSSLLVPAIIAGVVLIALALILLAGHPFARPVREYAMRDVEVKSSTDPAGGSVLGHFQRGDVVSGAWVTKPGGAKWLKVKRPGQGDGYISSRDLSDHARPRLASTSAGAQAVSTASVVHADPDQKSAVIDDLAQGESAATVGATADGWTEIVLNGGGVGYVKSAAFLPPASADAGAPGTAEAAAGQTPAQTARVGAITHYTCSYSAGESVNPPADTSPLSFYLDEGRACINHRYPYIADDAGGLKRVMLNEKSRRASLLYFVPGRGAFQRTDFTLAPAAWAELMRTSAELEAISCPPPGDAAAASAIKADLAKAMPALHTQAPGASWRRRVWQCTAG